MHFDLDDDERDLQQGIRALAEGRITMARVRAAAETDGVDRGLFTELAEAGVFALTMPEADGGLGLSETHAVVVFEELGRALAPGPLVATHLAAGGVEGAAEGTAIVGLVERDRHPLLVEHLASLDVLLVLDDDGVHRVEVADLDATAAARPLDPLTPVWSVTALPNGDQLGDPGMAQALRRRRDLLTSASLVGVAAAATDLAVAHAQQRTQFDKPIGAFQAVKHLCADMLTRAEVARASVHAAAVALADPTSAPAAGPARALAGAALLALDAATRNASACIQVHGGMGFTWEVDAHLLLKRAVAWGATMAGPDAQAELVAATL